MSTITLSDDQLAALADLVADRLRGPTPTSAQPELLDAEQVAARLGVSRQRVWAMSRRGEIPTVRLGPRDVRYREEDVEAWIARRTTTHPRGTR